VRGTATVVVTVNLAMTTATTTVSQAMAVATARTLVTERMTTAATTHSRQVTGQVTVREDTLRHLIQVIIIIIRLIQSQ